MDASAWYVVGAVLFVAGAYLLASMIWPPDDRSRSDRRG